MNGDVTLKSDKEALTEVVDALQRYVHRFGSIKFCGFGNQPTYSKFVRLDSTTPMDLLWTLLIDVWNLQKPNMVVSVTGGAKKFEMPNKLTRAFCQGLIDVATTTGAWIISGGTRTGVMRLVGEAVNEFNSCAEPQDQLVALGIATFGVVENRELFASPKPTEMKAKGVHIPIYNEMGQSKDTHGSVPLDQSHTHFLLVDDGTEGQYGREIAFRAKLEKYIADNSKTTLPACKDFVNTPVVLVVCEGGPGTIQQIAEAVIREVPVVIIVGSGRAADLVAIAFEMKGQLRMDYKLNDSAINWKAALEVPEDFIESLRVRSKEVHFTAKEFSASLPHLREILAKEQYVTMFNMKDDPNLDKAIVKALIKSTNNVKEQVNLALMWNYPDTASKEIFGKQFSMQGYDLEQEMLYALLHDSVDFVQLFLDNGIHMSRFLSVTCLLTLYKRSIQTDEDDGDDDRMPIIMKHLRRTVKVYYTLTCYSHRIITYKETGVQTSLPDPDAFSLDDVGNILIYLLKEESEHFYPAQQSDDDDDDVVNEEKIEDLMPSKCPERDVFVWAILLYKPKVARFMWSLSIDPLGKCFTCNLVGALYASRLLSSLANEAANNDHMGMSKQLLTEAQHYQDQAYNIATECRTRDRIKANALLTRESIYWGKTTALSLAANGYMMDFMNHPACQSKLTKIWFGHISQNTAQWKIALLIFCPILIPLVKFVIPENFLKQALENTPKVVQPNNEMELQDWIAIGMDEMRNRNANAKQNAKTKPKRLKFSFKLFPYFYGAPVTKFFMNVISHVTNLIFYTYILMSELTPIYDRTPRIIIEYFCWMWSFSIFIEELCQVGRADVGNIYFKIGSYFQSFWNILDCIINFLLIVATVIRLRNHPDEQYYAQTAYALMVLLLFLRFVAHFFVSKTIGPTIIMIQRMLKDLVFFLCVLIVFILSFGVPIQALLYPYAPFTFELLVDAIYTPYWQVFGDIGMDRIEGNKGEHCPTENNSLILSGVESSTCVRPSPLVPVLTAVYMMLTNVLLLNLLIAMFSNTFQQVQENSEKVWRFYRYSLTYEAYTRPALTPPLTLLVYAYRAIRWCLRKVAHRPTAVSIFRVELPEAQYAELSRFERSGLKMYQFKERRKEFAMRSDMD